MPTISTANLRIEVSRILQKQGYKLKSDGVFALKNNEQEEKRKVHELAKAERVSTSESFLLDKIPFIEKYLINGKDLDVAKIEPQVIEIEGGSPEEDFFRWWNIIWWSLPYEHAYGRQMRFLIWDKYHNAPIGLIGLQSPTGQGLSLPCPHPRHVPIPGTTTQISNCVF